tara:strand:+ start:957 stop:2150 length:1194 start_codon:yes stop_codon:yes gene_type:complete
VLAIPVIDHPGEVEWFLPPSKSHMIRWIALSSQCSTSTRLIFQGVPGHDIISMADCVEEMGASIQRESGHWIIQGGRGLRPPKSNLDCGNSATAAKILSFLVACLDSPVVIDGDSSLRRRDFSQMTKSLADLGCKVSSDRLPLEITGPISGGRTRIDESTSSQTLTAMILASAGLKKQIGVSLYGDAVSRWYRDLTVQICNDCGWTGILNEEMILCNWEVETPKKVEIPPEVSLFPLSVLFDLLHGTRSLDHDLTRFRSPVLKATKDALSTQKDKVDLRDSSDIIAPCAAIMALGKGGEILGAPHARGKESDRITSTVGLLSAFGMVATETDTGLKIPGGQFPSRPRSVFDCELDHRLAMTAGVLATKVGADLSGYEISDVTHPGFFEMITVNGSRI